jgi:hypothetical protein
LRAGVLAERLHPFKRKRLLDLFLTLKSLDLDMRAKLAPTEPIGKLALPKVSICRSSIPAKKIAWDERKTHFDTNHMLTIIWDAAKPKETGDALTATIRATLRAEARQQD